MRLGKLLLAAVTAAVSFGSGRANGVDRECGSGLAAGGCMPSLATVATEAALPLVGWWLVAAGMGAEMVLLFCS